MTKHDVHHAADSTKPASILVIAMTITGCNPADPGRQSTSVGTTITSSGGEGSGADSSSSLDDDSGDSTPGSTSPGSSDGGADSSGGDDGADSPSIRLDVENVSSGDTTDTEGECAAVSEMAVSERQPADILVVVDNSGSMQAEAGFVQTNLNTFSQQIIDSGIDVHVALISSYPNVGFGICIDAPLGIGMCPNTDDNPPLFEHVDIEVGSNDALETLIARYPDWQTITRPNASKHIVVVSDDESDMDATAFDSMFKALDPSLASYVVHAIVAPVDPFTACFSGNVCCGLSAARGQVYFDLVDQTMGVMGNLCEQDFQAVFDRLSTAVISGSKLSCEWDIPDPPAGTTFDPGKVNLEFDDGAGTVLKVGKVDDASMCASVTDGWYYDDPSNPQSVLVCPQTCTKIQGFVGGRIDILFGCASMPAD